MADIYDFCAIRRKRMTEVAYRAVDELMDQAFRTGAEIGLSMQDVAQAMIEAAL